MEQDLQHLKLLAIFHYVVGGIIGLFACMPIFHFAMGLFLVFGSDSFIPQGEGPPAIFGWFFVVIALVMILLGWAVAIIVLLAGNYLRQQTHHTFCLVVAAIECLFMPFGTVLGIFTIIVLMKDSVKQLFEDSRYGGPVSPPPFDKPKYP